MDAHEQIPDATLVERAVNGDATAFRLIVRRYTPVVAKTAHGMLGHGTDAEDVGQEALIRLYKSLANFRREASLKTYVTRITINLCLDALRARKRRKWQFWQSIDDENEPDIPDDRQDTEAFAKQQLIDKAMNMLEPNFRSVAVLRLVEGYSTEETSEILGIPQGTVLSRLSRAKTQLKNLLKEHLHV